MKYFRIKLFYKLLTLLLVILILPLVLIEDRIVSNVTDVMLSDIVERRKEVVRELFEKIIFVYDVRMHDCINLIARHLSASIDDERTLRGYLSTLIESHDDIQMCTIFDTSRNPVMTVWNKRIGVEIGADSDGIQSLKNLESYHADEIIQMLESRDDTVIDDVFYAEPIQSLLLSFGKVVHLSGKRHYLIVRTTTTRVQEYIGRRARRYRESVYIVDRKGRLVAHPDYERALSREDFAHQEPVAAFLEYMATGIGSTQTGQIPRNRPYYGVYMPVKPLQWCIVVEKSGTFVNQRLSRIRNILKFWMIMSVFLACCGALILAMYIVRPITRLSRGAEKIARGEFDTRIHINSSDEIGAMAGVFNRMSEELKQIHELNIRKIIGEKNKTEAIMQNMADGLVVFDKRLEIVNINNQIERLFSVRKSDLIGRKYSALFDDAAMQKHLKKMLACSPLENVSVDIPVPSKDGREVVIFRVTSTRIIDREYSGSLIISIVRNITSDKKLEHLQSELLATISHEVRVPLTSIRGFSDLIAHDDISAGEMKEYAETVYIESCRLTHLMNDFTELSKLERGETPVDRSETDIITILNTVLSAYGNEAGEKEIQLIAEYEKDVSVMKIDGAQIEQAISKLVENAIRFSPRKSVVHMKCMVRDEKVFIEVNDRGCGISQNEITDIFTAFYKSSKSRYRTERGNGLGLPLAKAIIERHGGVISVQSRLGHGSSFKIMLPIV
jgi:PAS domain S-box-containing protein